MLLPGNIDVFGLNCALVAKKDIFYGKYRIVEMASANDSFSWSENDIKVMLQAWIEYKNVDWWFMKTKYYIICL